jgi:hypothetical protein
MFEEFPMPRSPWKVLAAMAVAASLIPLTFAQTSPAGRDLRTGWVLLREGEAQGTIEQDARHPTNDAPHLLRLSVTKTAGPGAGRVGAVNDAHLEVHEGAWYDITFTAATERGSIGLVFSLESADGKVLARTTLPEIGRGRGRGRGGPPATAPAAWTPYLVSLHARAAAPSARLVITPIEPTNVWLDGITFTPRQHAP